MPCARCLDPVAQKLEEHFDLLFRPAGVDADASEHAISTSDTEIGYYEGGRLVVEDVLREQVLLSLPARSALPAGMQRTLPSMRPESEQRDMRLRYGQVDARWTALADLRSKIKS